MQSEGNSEFPGGLVVRILGFHCHAQGSVPGLETEVSQAMQHGQKKKKKWHIPLLNIPTSPCLDVIHVCFCFFLANSCFFVDICVF